MAVTPLETVRTLEARVREERLRREQREREVRQAVETAVRRTQPPGARAWLIGSLAWGGFDETSDVDLVLDGWPAGLINQLEHAVATAAGAEVDLLVLSELSAEDQERVRTEGVALHD